MAKDKTVAKKTLHIDPLPGIVYLKTEDVKVGGLDTSPRDSAIEYAEVLAVGEGVGNIKKGDYVFVKAWATDIISHDSVQYKFVSVETKGILAIVK